MPLNISKECMDHFYPDNTASISELDYEHLTIDEMTAPFIALICMSILAFVGLIFEIIFDKIQNRLNRDTKDVVESVDEKYEVHYVAHLTTTTDEHEKFRQKFELLLSEFNVYQNKTICDGNEAFEYWFDCKISSKMLRKRKTVFSLCVAFLTCFFLCNFLA